MTHKAVLLKETVDFLDPKKNGVYVDLTLGAGGHSTAILERAGGCTLICFDLDKKSIDNFTNELKEKGFKEESGSFKKNGNQVYLVNRNFSELPEVLESLKIERVDGVLADLGWSSDQLDSVPGLSYAIADEELDMRLGKELGVTASDLLNVLGKKELEMMFEKYADIHGNTNQRLVTEITNFRKKTIFKTVGDLLKVVNKSYSFSPQNRFENKNSVYSRVFQALRIAVNSEIKSLEEMLNKAFGVLKVGGVFCVIIFHSGEEKLVKGFFTVKENEGEAEVISKKGPELSIRPTVEELKDNIRSRSAKLFVIKKTAAK